MCGHLQNTWIDGYILDGGEKMAIIKIKSHPLIILLVTLLVVFLPSFITTAKAIDQAAQINIVYFYNNPCAACNEEGEFIELFNFLLGADKKGVEINLAMYNVFHASSENLLHQYYEKYGVPKEKQITPILFVNDEFLSGSTAIKEGLRDVFLKEKDRIVNDTAGKGEDSQTTTILYFYVTGCKECEEVTNFLGELKKRYLVESKDGEFYTYVKVKKFNIGEPENLKLVKEYFKLYKVPEKAQSVPIIFIGDTYLSGLEAIQRELVEKIKSGEGIGTLDLSMETQDDIRSFVNLSGYDVLGVLMAGLVNGLNPCSLSMMLFFLSLLVAKGTNILKMGFSFCLGKFLAYLLLGTLLFNVFLKFQVPWFSASVKGIILVAVFVIIMMNVRDYLAAKHEKYDKIRLQLPARLRRYNHEWIKKLSSIENVRLLLVMNFVLGMIISVGEFLCTGQIYLATIIYVLRNSPAFNLKALLYFVLYDLAFITPLLLVTYLIHKGKEVFDVSDVVRARMPIIKLINAMLFFIFGLIILIWF